MKSKLVGAALFASLIVPFAAQARDNNAYGRPGNVVYRVDGGPNELRKIDERQREQNERIARGLRSGELTRAEADRLIREQRDIREQERRYLADGHLSRAERGALHAELNQASRHIHGERHDSQQRF